MKLPRDLAGARLVRALERIGYRVTRTSGSHVRLTCTSPVEHHVTVPLHDPVRIGTLAAIIDDVAAAQGVSRDDVLGRVLKR